MTSSTSDKAMSEKVSWEDAISEKIPSEKAISERAGSLADDKPVEKGAVDSVVAQIIPQQDLLPHDGQSDAPDGGLKAWLRVLAAWLLFVVTWGPALSYPVFQEYYGTNLLQNKSASDVSWIGGTTTDLLIMVGAIAGPLFDRGYLKPLMLLGCFLQIFGFMMLSLSTEYYQIYLSQGLCVGIGCGLVYVPALAFVTVSFTKRRAMAIGVTTTGSSVGGIIFPSLFRGLIHKVGFGWTVRTIGFVQLGCALIAFAILYDAPVHKSKPRRLIDWKAFKGLGFDAFLIVGFCQFLSYWVVLFYIPSFATLKIGLSKDDSIYLTVVILNAASFFGRIIPQLAVQRYGAAQIITIANLIAAIIVFSWLAVESEAGLIIWSVAIGFTTGCFVSANPILAAHPLMSPSLDVVGTRLGMLWFAGGVGSLIGGPIAGALIDPTTLNFLPAQVFCGGIMTLGFLFAAVILTLILRKDRQERNQRLSVSSE